MYLVFVLSGLIGKTGNLDSEGEEEPMDTTKEDPESDVTSYLYFNSILGRTWCLLNDLYFNK